MAGMTIEEFIRQYKKESPFEMVDGERHPVKLMVAGHATVLKNLYDPLSQYVKEHQLGEVYYRLPYLILDNDGLANNSCLPDLIFISKERFLQYTAATSDWKEKPLLTVPDLAVQIEFYDDNGESYDKARNYLNDGVQIVWIINVRYRMVQIWRHSHFYNLYMNEKITGGEIIPGFSINIAMLFRDIVSEYDDLRQQVAKQIEEAFADTPYPGDENVSHYEYEIDKEAFRGKHWKDIALETIFRERGELSFFTPEAYRFYLPAFMLATLLHYSEVDTLSGNLINHLSPERSNISLKDFFLRMNSGFSQVEQAAILAFLESYLILYPNEYSEEDRVYRPLLDSALEYWK